MSKHVVVSAMRGFRDVGKFPGRSIIIILTIAIGVSLAIGLIAIANGVDDHVKILLQALPQQVNLISVHQTLDDARDALTYLTYLFSCSFVAIVTSVSMEKRRYYISVKRIRGNPRVVLITEFLVESIVLCIIGGFLGIWLGFMLCQLIPHVFPHLPTHFRLNDAFRVFPQLSGLSWIFASVITIILSLRPNPTRQR